jgi:hypothetical protein
MWFTKKPFHVKMTGRTGLLYEENGRRMFVDSEMLSGDKFDLVIYTDSIKAWQSPHEGELVSENDKLRIRENITKELRRLRIDWA